MVDLPLESSHHGLVGRQAGNHPGRYHPRLHHSRLHHSRLHEGHLPDLLVHGHVLAWGNRIVHWVVVYWGTDWLVCLVFLLYALVVGFFLFCVHEDCDEGLP